MIYTVLVIYTVLAEITIVIVGMLCLKSVEPSCSHSKKPLLPQWVHVGQRNGGSGLHELRSHT